MQPEKKTLITKRDFLHIVLYCVVFAVVVFLTCHPVSAANPYEGYYIDGIAITSYSHGIVTLADGRTILDDTTNESIYISRITYNPKMSAVISTTSSNYAETTKIVNTNQTFQKYDPLNTTRIDQGDAVYLGETVDIAGIGWYTGSIAYAGPYFDAYDLATANNATLITHEIQARNLSAYYVDPGYFHDKLGWWYVYYNGENSKAGNDRLFYVIASEEYAISSKPNETIAEINTTLILQNETERLANLTRQTVKTEPGYDAIISKGVDTNIEVSQTARIWAFGINSGDSLYDLESSDGTFTLLGRTTRNLESGQYDLITIVKDANGLYEQRYHKNTSSIISPFRNIKDIYIGDKNSRTAESILINAVNNSINRNFSIARVFLQDPDIQITKLDQVTLANNNTYFVLSGYTNMNPGCNLTIQFDKNLTGDASLTRYAMVSDNGGVGAYRVWNSSFIVHFKNVFPGIHFITVQSDYGASATVPFYVYKELPKHYQPDVYLEYIGNSPFTPPVIVNVTVPVPGPTQYIYVNVTPSQESVNAAQYKALIDLCSHIGMGIVVVAGIGFVARFLYRAWKRRRWMKE